MAETSSSIGTALEKMTDTIAIIGVLSEVTQEIWSAIDQHGKQPDVPHGYGDPHGAILNDLHWQQEGRKANIAFLEHDALEVLAKRACEDDRDWAKITLEEFFEAMAAPTPEETRAELVQFAAMAVRSVLAFDAQQVEA